MYHKPVLLQESINGLAINPNGIYIDTTFGGGGHSKEILKKLDKGKLVAFDQDEDSKQNKIDDERFLLLNHNFRYLKNFLKYLRLSPVDGILSDLGISSHQIDVRERGFSSRLEGPIDLRMDRKLKVTGADIINSYSEDHLCKIFKEYGEIAAAKKVANVIVKSRNQEKIETISGLKKTVEGIVPKQKENKFHAQILQALRIAVNDELEALRELIIQACDSLKPGGRFVILTYHSLEDRIVKNFFKSGDFEGKLDKDFYGITKAPFKVITRKPIIPDENEIITNSRARSAKLRIAEKI
ncbi:16S rRNA (cytosine(1402)-N(4))-methyltransferase RsmH [Bacteroidota bacterium]